jgi:fatty acyl-CoA reductase
VREVTPQSFQKLKFVRGDISIDGLDMSESDENELIENCQLIFHCAANVRFDLNLKDAVNLNTCGTERVLKLAEKMKNLLVFSYVSTAYSHCKEDILEEKYYPASENPYGIIKMTQLLKSDTLELITPR